MNEQQSQTETDLIERVRAVDVRAPEELHRRVQALVAERRPPMRSPRTRWLPRSGLALGIAAATVSAAAVVLVFALPGGDSHKLSVREVASKTLLVATTAPPRENPRLRSTLTASVDGLRFPYWNGHFGWRASGARSDTVDGQTVRTVFYTDARGQRIGYAITAGELAHSAIVGKVVRLHGQPYWLARDDGVASVVWLRSGHLCVVTGRGVASSTLLALASWDEQTSTV
jgi:hypothetical protein